MSYSFLFEKLRRAIIDNDTTSIANFVSYWTSMKHRDPVHLLLSESVKYNLEQEVIYILIQHKATFEFHKLLKFTVFRGNVPLTKELLSMGLSAHDILDHNNESSAQFIFRIRNQDIRREMLLLFLNHGLNASGIYNNYGQNLLHQFVNNHVERVDLGAVLIAEILLSYGVSLDSPDNYGHSPLHYAVVIGNTDLVIFLLQQGADVNKRTHDKKTPLLTAAPHDFKDVAELLIRHGAGVNDHDLDGNTALHVACLSRSDELIKLLLREGAYISAEDAYGKTPFSMLLPDSWDGGNDHCTRCIITMIKEFAILSFEKRGVSQKDMDLILGNPKSREYFDRCTAELKMMTGSLINKLKGF